MPFSHPLIIEMRSPHNSSEAIAKKLTISSLDELENRFIQEVNDANRKLNKIKPIHFKHPRKLKDLLVDSCVHVVVSAHDDDMKELENALRHVAKKLPSLEKVTIAGKRDDDPLIAKLQSIIQARDKEIYRRRNKAGNALFWSALGGALTVMGASVFVVTFNIVTQALFGWGMDALRQWYLDSAAKHFMKKKQIRAIPLNEHRVLTALEKGARSVKWCPYLLSYFSYSALRHPRVFAAGMELAIEGKEDNLEVIRQQYEHRIR